MRFRGITLAVAAGLLWGCGGGETGPEVRIVKYRIPQPDTARRAGAAPRYTTIVDTIVTPRVAPVLHPARPISLPSAAVWRPRRHFGPFNRGSDLGKIQVLVNGLSATWYFNDFFSTVDADAKAVYQIYYRPDYTQAPSSSVVLPSTATPELLHLPGAPTFVGAFDYPTRSDLLPRASYPNGWADHLLLSLRTISYSARYGGTIALEFRAAPQFTRSDGSVVPDIFEYEFGVGSTLYDVDGLTMTVYVTPQPEQMNPKSNARRFQTPTNVEFAWSGVRAYVEGQGTVPFEGPVTAQLQSILQEVTGGVRQAIGAPTTGYVRAIANQFAHAWLHDEFQDLIASDDKVTRIYLDENWADLRTEKYQTYLFAAWQSWGIWDIDNGLFDEYPHDWTVNIGVEQFYADANPMPVSGDEYEVEDYDDGPWINLGGFTLAQCPTLNHISMAIDLKERDTATPDDQFDAETLDLQLHCPASTVTPDDFSEHVVPGGILPDAEGKIRFTPTGEDHATAELHWHAALRIVWR